MSALSAIGARTRATKSAHASTRRAAHARAADKHTGNHRGTQLAGVFVDAALWPVPENLVEEIGPCLYRDGGGFYTRPT